MTKYDISNAWDEYLRGTQEEAKPQRGSWYDYFMELAKVVATRSKDPRTQVGCVITTSDKVVASTGYNGLPRGVADREDRMQPPQKYLWTAHAEENAVAQAARVGRALEGGTAFVTHEPCCRCARALIQAGVTTVVVGDGVTSMPDDEFQVARAMFEEAGVEVIAL